MDDILSSSQVVMCPRCGARAVPIVWGMPDGDLVDAMSRGEIWLGGCIVSDDDPSFACTAEHCGLQFA